jgi:hypothetical protein
LVTISSDLYWEPRLVPFISSYIVSRLLTIASPWHYSYFENQNQYQQHYSNDASLLGYFPHNQQHPMAVTSLLDSSLPETVISDEKSQEIIDLIKERFTETDHAPVAKQKEALLDGDRSSDTHMMSRKMMQVYIASFWSHFHPQLPICEYCFIVNRLYITRLGTCPIRAAMKPVDFLRGQIYRSKYPGPCFGC